MTDEQRAIFTQAALAWLNDEITDEQLNWQGEAILNEPKSTSIMTDSSQEISD